MRRSIGRRREGYRELRVFIGVDPAERMEAVPIQDGLGREALCRAELAKLVTGAGTAERTGTCRTSFETRC